MPITHIYCTEQPIFVDEKTLAVKSPSIREVRATLAHSETDFEVLEPGTITDITPPCFAGMVAEGSMPDNRYMADVAKDGESAAISVLEAHGTTKVLHMSTSHDGSNTIERGGTSSLVSVAHQELVIGHSIQTLGQYIGGLVLYLPERKLELFKRFYGAKE